MRICLWLFLWLLHHLLFAQEPVYQPFEVDSAASPQGGSEALNDFLLANLRKSSTAMAERFSGRITLTGVAERDGRVSGVRLLTGLRPDCDRETQRIFALFNAWKPALKDGKAVRQQITYSFVIPAQHPYGHTVTPFYYRNGVRTEYLNTARFPVADTASTNAHYKVVAPMTDNWIPTGDIIHFERQALGGWKQTERLRLVRTELIRRTTTGKRIYRIGHLNAANQWVATQYDVDEDSVLLRLTTFSNGVIERTIRYTEAGMQVESVRYSNMLILNQIVPFVEHINWDTNGQIREKRYTFPSGAPERVFQRWDSYGNKIIDKGNGWVDQLDTVPSYADPTRRTGFVEHGFYSNAFKEGLWTGRYEDDSYAYEEYYEQGVCRWGKAKRYGHDTLHYTLVEQEAEFLGGTIWLRQFLKHNSQYAGGADSPVPVVATVRFTVRPDGTTGDYELSETDNVIAGQEALRLVRLTSGQWKPALKRGEQISTSVTLPINLGQP